MSPKLQRMFDSRRTEAQAIVERANREADLRQQSRQDTADAIERQDMLNRALGLGALQPKLTFQCMDCGAWWQQHGTPEVCIECKCPSPVRRA